MNEREREEILAKVLARFTWGTIKSWLPECSDDAIEFCEKKLKMKSNTRIKLKHFEIVKKENDGWTNWFIDELLDNGLLKGKEIAVFIQESTDSDEEDLVDVLIECKSSMMTSKEKSETIRDNLRGDMYEFLRAVNECELTAPDVFDLLNDLNQNEIITEDREDDVINILIRYKRKLTSRQKTKIIRKLRGSIKEFLWSIKECDLAITDVFDLLNELDEQEIACFEDDVADILIKYNRMARKKKAEMIRKLNRDACELLRALDECDLPSEDAIPLLTDTELDVKVFYSLSAKRMADVLIKNKDDATTEEKLAIIRKLNESPYNFLRAVKESDLSGDNIFNTVFGLLTEVNFTGHEKEVVDIINKYSKTLGAESSG